LSVRLRPPEPVDSARDRDAGRHPRQAVTLGDHSLDAQ
jgi:hypothetical protein